jgi:hypothetical protein
VELYGKLYYLTDYTVSALKERGMLNEDILEEPRNIRNITAV